MTKYIKKYKTKHKKQIKTAKLIRNIIIIIILILVYICIKPKKKNTDILLVLNNEEITSKLSDRLFNANNIVFMSYEDIASFIDKTIYKEDDKTIITTSSKKVARLEIENNTIMINGAEKQINSGPIKINEKIFLPISELESVYDIDFQYSKTSNIVIIEDLSIQKKVATAKKKISIKEDKSLFSKTLDKVKKGEKVVYIEQDDKWSKVMSQEGYIGYVNTNKLIDIAVEREEFKMDEKSDDNKYLEKDIFSKDISSFEKRQDLIDTIFTEAIKKEKKQIRIKGNIEDENFKRFEIEAVPIFNECGLKCEFIDLEK